MDKCLYFFSESLILTLCKEIEYIRNRSINIKNSLKTCQNEILSKRLILELDKLNKKRINIKNISEDLLKNNSKDLSHQFLFEITKRSHTYQQL